MVRALRAEVKSQKSKVKSNLFSPKFGIKPPPSGGKTNKYIKERTLARVFNQSIFNPLS